MHPRSNPAHPDLPPSFRLTNPRSARPPPTYSWCNYAHYAQYRTNPRSDFHPRPQMNNSSKCNANRQSYVSSVPEMRTWPILLIKSDLKWCIHIVYNACTIYIYINYEVYHAFILFWDSFHLTSCRSNIWFLCWISYWSLRVVFRNKY